MIFSNMRISSLLRLGLGTILMLVLLIGTLSWRQTDVLWEQTQGLYKHPLTVSRTLGELKTTVRDLSLHAQRMLFAQGMPETMAILQEIEADKARATPLFAILFERYLGPREDIEILQREFAKWNALRDETVRLLRSGDKTSTEDRIRSGGVQDSQARIVDLQLQKIDAFARNKADEFFKNATNQNSSLNRQLAAIVAAIFLATLLIGGLLLRRIKQPLSELTRLSEEFGHGRLDARSQYASTNEFGLLSTAFNAMADAIQRQAQVSERAAALSATMMREEEIHAFCQVLLKSLLDHTGSQAGAIYVLNEAKTEFERIESIGLTVADHPPFSATAFEGEPGATAAAREIRRITDIPSDTRFRHSTMSGDILPREILSIPVLSENTVVAVISLTSVHAYDTTTVKLINDLRTLLSARIEGILIFRKLASLAERLELNNQQLDDQRRELSAQASELAEQNIELEMQKKHLDEANRLKSAFLSNMSHELRTPLNSVIALSGVLSRRLSANIPEEEFGYLQIIERNGKNLLELINDILDLSRIEAGYEEINPSHFSMNELIDEIVGMLEPLTLEKHLALTYQAINDLPVLYSDRTKCRHILQNIVGNAVKFTEQGEVSIKAKTAGDHIEITIADTGIGIAASELPFIFDEFRQGDGSTSRKYEGTGLGLAIARKYARMLEGNIFVRSKPGEGSTFTLLLPLRTETAPERPMVGKAVSPSLLPTPAKTHTNLLIVEDSEPAIIQLTDILQPGGYNLHVARNGKEALASIEQTIPDAMILDLMMPEVDGFQVIRSVRERPETSQLPILIEGHGPTPTQPLVLIVEDNHDNRLTLTALLQDHYRTIEAADGRSGVELARLHRPDIILMDIAMPALDGVQALRLLRADPRLATTPVIAVTAFAMKGDSEDLLAKGFDACLSKPIDEIQLFETLRRSLA